MGYAIAPAGPITARPSMSHPPIAMPDDVRAAWRAYLAECPRAGVEALRDEMLLVALGASKRITDAKWMSTDSALRVTCACPMLFPWWAAGRFDAKRDDLAGVIGRYNGHKTYGDIYEWIDANEPEETLPRLLEVVEEFLSAAPAKAVA